ncbi:MAG: PRC-barrel domain-containing protein [Bradyrhizobium sp.]|uniref:PRC-barrel domain-containing protein n=1 Tax=Bradyrhizobium sp. TaxID=376 RepID=UPI001C295ACD|nr:PRC-barrel domain-containing protein [Bradyrhizobium sp.]MBU6462564.1 PRC-barrel domain-containing protein [Pseudomonadota bacterium]MDE2067185.1 PRC-barrel domain-containing protein [Bradyrhizobium sp.]MDE2471548.1 PRC-barrel domain-containing protein [Bradyrhizobium sp.]
MTNEESACPFIASDRVVGTPVYGPDRERLGSIERVMIDISSGCVEYAELSFGGFLGLGNDHYPIPWKLLRYDTELGGYLTNMTGLPDAHGSSITETMLG